MATAAIMGAASLLSKSGALSAIGASVAHLFNGGPQDVMSAIWKHIQPSDAWRFNVTVQGDGWHDATSGAKLSQEEADRRVTTLIATYVGAVRGSDGYWRDKDTDVLLTSAQAFARWTATYGQGATAAMVLQSPPQYVSGSSFVSAAQPIDPAVAYIQQQIGNVGTAINRAGSNIAGVAVGAGAGAQAGAQYGAQAAIAAQNAKEKQTLYIAGGIILLLGAVLFFGKRK